MSIIQSEINAEGQAFQTNAKHMLAAINQFRDIERGVIEAAKAKETRYRKRGLLPPRDRLTHLLDKGAPFLELSTLCGYLQEDDTDGSSAGGNSIAGIGYVEGALCMVIVDDYLTKGGSISELGGVKRQRMLNLALNNHLPVIALAQSGGGNLTSLGDWFGFSGVGFAIQARLSAAGLPQVTVVHGSATAGGCLSTRFIGLRNNDS